MNKVKSSYVITEKMRRIVNETLGDIEFLRKEDVGKKILPGNDGDNTVYVLAEETGAYVLQHILNANTKTVDNALSCKEVQMFPQHPEMTAPLPDCKDRVSTERYADFVNASIVMGALFGAGEVGESFVKEHAREIAALRRRIL